MSLHSKMHNRGQLFFSLIILAFLAWAQLVQDLSAARVVIPAASDGQVEAWQVWERGWLQRYRPLLGPGLFTLAILLVGVPVMLRHPRWRIGRTSTGRRRGCRSGIGRSGKQGQEAERRSSGNSLARLGRRPNGPRDPKPRASRPQADCPGWRKDHTKQCGLKGRGRFHPRRCRVEPGSLGPLGR